MLYIKKWKKNMNGNELYTLVCNCFNRWFSLEHNNAVSEICRHDEVVFNNKSSLLCMQNKPTPV